MSVLEIRTVKKKETELIEVGIGEKTNLLIEVGWKHRDIRLCDGKSVLKIGLNHDLSIGLISKDDVPCVAVEVKG